MTERADLLCEIVAWVSDEPQPGWVEARFSDAAGKPWSVFDKSAIFTSEPINRDSPYPVEGSIRCEVRGRGTRPGGASVARVVLIDSPHGAEDREFEVNASQLEPVA
jgi:hypothetical protein